jgi:hypothetical protein
MSEESGPIFVVGCARSGTTLLRLMLNAHPELAIPQESHFVYEIALLRARGRWPRRLDEPQAWQRFRTYLRAHRYLAQWGLPMPAIEAAAERVEGRTHALVFTAIFEAYRDHEGKPRWGDKTPPHVGYLLLLERLFPNARFVHIVRDGRDVALSLGKIRSWGPRRIALAGHYWTWKVLTGLVSGAVLGPDRCRTVCYEALVREPEATLRSLFTWLDLSFDPAVLRYYETRAARTHFEGKPWRGHVTEPPDEALIGRWKSLLSPHQVASLHRQAGPLLSHLGYEVDADSATSRQREIARLLEPAVVRAIDERGCAWSGSEVQRQLRLRIDEGLRVLAFARRRYQPWAMRDLRWQRTVAGMLD